MSTEVVIFTLVVDLAKALFRYLPLRSQARLLPWLPALASLFVSCCAGSPARGRFSVPDPVARFPSGRLHYAASGGPVLAAKGYK